MIKLSDTQLVILTKACQREGRFVLPLPDRLKGGAAAKVVESLLAKGLVEEVDVERGEPVWRATGDDHWTTLVATDAAFAALGIDAGGASDERAEAASETDVQDADVANDASPAEPDFPTPKPESSAPARRTRADSKQAKLIKMLKRSEGATIDEIAAAFGWQAHTVRGAIAGALKKKLGLDVVSEKIEGRRVYRIVD